jgi:hypothetical protein
MEKNQAEEYPDKPNLSPVSESSSSFSFTDSNEEEKAV